MPVTIGIGGGSGKGKSLTALSSRGRIGLDDVDNQAWIYAQEVAGRPVRSDRFGSLIGNLVGIFRSNDPAEYTREKLAARVRAWGLGKGDTYICDPWSEVWAAMVDASGFSAMGQKIDWFKTKTPLRRALTAIRNLPCDRILIMREKQEWGPDPVTGKVAPTGNIIFDGERQKSEYEIPFQFRMETRGPTHVMVVTKQKGGFFRLGEEFPDPNLREILAARGLYQWADSVVEPETASQADAAIAAADTLYGGGNSSPATVTAYDTLEAGIRAAVAAGALTEYRKSDVARSLAGKLGPAELARIKSLIAHLTGGE